MLSRNHSFENLSWKEPTSQACCTFSAAKMLRPTPPKTSAFGELPAWSTLTLGVLANAFHSGSLWPFWKQPMRLMRMQHAPYMSTKMRETVSPCLPALEFSSMSNSLLVLDSNLHVFVAVLEKGWRMRPIVQSMSICCNMRISKPSLQWKFPTPPIGKGCEFEWQAALTPHYSFRWQKSWTQLPVFNAFQRISNFKQRLEAGLSHNGGCSGQIHVPPRWEQHSKQVISKNRTKITGLGRPKSSALALSAGSCRKM